MKKIQTKVLITASFALLAGFMPVLGAQTYGLPNQGSNIATIQSSSLISMGAPGLPEKVIGHMNVVITAYSSTIGQTDDTPFITASGKNVRPGIVATNVLPFGTRIKIPSVYGDKIFTVEDRMNARKHYQVDVWFPDYVSAKDFGVKYANIEILGS